MEVLQFQRFLIILMVGGVTTELDVRNDSHNLYEIQLERRDRHTILDQVESQENRSATPLFTPQGATLLLIQVKQYERMLKLIDDESKTIKAFNASAKGTDFGWKNYYHLETIYDWLDHLAENYSDIITLITIGKTYEGRPIKGVKLSHKKGNSAVFIEAGIHAREWISPATATFILNQLLTSTDSKVKYFAKNFDWHVFPVCNPDGYKFSFDADRLWRMNREPVGKCFGVDLNRNFDAKWTMGSERSKPCSETYPGPHVFSAAETKAIAEYLRRSVESERIETYLSFHSAQQTILYPYGVNSTKPPNYDDLKKIAEKAVEALASRNGKKFLQGGIHQYLKNGVGTSVDWVYSKLNVLIAYAYELRHSKHPDESDDMMDFIPAAKIFLLPADEIEKTGFETLDSVLALLDEAEKLGYYKQKSTSDSTSYHFVIFYGVGFGILLSVILAGAYFGKKYDLFKLRPAHLMDVFYHTGA